MAISKRAHRIILACCLAALGAFATVYAVVAYKVHQITHPRRAANYAMTDDDARPIPQAPLTTADGLSLAGWHQPSRNGATIVLQHGYRSNSAQMLTIGRMLARHGYGFLCFDFRAHGKSEGDTVTLGLHETQDTDAAVAYLGQLPGPRQRIGLFGISMGGAVGLLAAAGNRHIEAVAVEAAFAELKDEVGIGITVQTPLPPSPLDAIFVALAERQTGYRLSDAAPVRRIGEISPRPVLLITGGADERILPDSGARLFAAAGEPKEHWHDPSIAHSAFFRELPQEFERRLVSFFDRSLLGSGE